MYKWSLIEPFDCKISNCFFNKEVYSIVIILSFGKCALMERLAKIVQKNVTVSTILLVIMIAVHVHQELVNQDGLGNPVVKVINHVK
jgi:hypothetical protein